MVGISEQPTGAIQQFLLADGGVALKLGAGYLTTDATGKLRISGGLPAAIDEGEVVGDQTE